MKIIWILSAGFAALTLAAPILEAGDGELSKRDSEISSEAIAALAFIIGVATKLYNDQQMTTPVCDPKNDATIYVAACLSIATSRIKDNKYLA